MGGWWNKTECWVGGWSDVAREVKQGRMKWSMSEARVRGCRSYRSHDTLA